MPNKRYIKQQLKKIEREQNNYNLAVDMFLNMYRSNLDESDFKGEEDSDYDMGDIVSK